MPTISAIIPVYKAEPYIHRCIDSILSQTYTDFELILVDDGSPDNCGAICDEYAAKDSRIHVIHQENGGVSTARNAGLTIAIGEYISFIDSDDWVANNFFSKAMDAILDSGCDIFMSGFYVMSAENCIEKKAVEETITVNKGIDAQQRVSLWKAWYITGPCAKFFSKKVIGANRFDQTLSFGEDMKFVNLVLNNAKSIIASPDAYYYIRVRQNSLSHGNVTEKQLLSVRKSEQFIIENYYYLYNEKNEYYYFMTARLSDIYHSFYSKIVYSKTNAFQKVKYFIEILDSPIIKQELKHCVKWYWRYPLTAFCAETAKALMNRVMRVLS